MDNSVIRGEAEPGKLERAIQVLLMAYFIAIPFQTVWVLPWIREKFQPPEVIFIPLFILTTLYFFRNRHKFWFSFLDVGVLAWLGVNVFSGLHSGLSVSIAVELVGILYLTLMYFVVRLAISQQLLKRLPNLITLGCVIAALIGILGWCLKAAGIDNPLMDNIDYLPYFGDIFGRARAFTHSCGMLANILMIGIIIKCADCWDKKEMSRRDYLMAGIMLCGFLLTLSKTLICLIIGLLLVWHFSTTQKINRKQNILVWVTVLSLSVFYFFNTHFLTTTKPPTDKKLLKEFIAGDPSPVFHWNSYQLVPTKYYVIFQTNIFAIKESFPWGIGPGAMVRYSAGLDRKGLIIPFFSDSDGYKGTDPHSTPLGTLSQLGLPGTIGLLLLWGIVGYGCYLARKCKGNRGLTIGVTASLIAISVSALVTDVMNFRHAWWLLAVTAVLWRSTGTVNSTGDSQ